MDEGGDAMNRWYRVSRRKWNFKYRNVRILSIEKYRNVNYSLIYLLIEIGQILEKWK